MNRETKRIIHACNRAQGSHDLTAKRNMKLLQRYHFMTEIQRRRTDDVITILSADEFFISEQTVWRIIKQNINILNRISTGELEQFAQKPENPDQIELFK